MKKLYEAMKKGAVGLTLIGSLLGGADESKAQNIIYSDNKEYSTIGDQIFLKSKGEDYRFARFKIDENTNIDLDDYFGLKAQFGGKDGISFGVMNAESALGQAIEYLSNDSRSRQMSEGDREKYRNILRDLLEDFGGGDRDSISLLEKAVQDKKINSSDLLIENGELKFREGDYVIIARSDEEMINGRYHGDQSIPILACFYGDDPSVCYVGDLMNDMYNLGGDKISEEAIDSIGVETFDDEIVQRTSLELKTEIDSMYQTNTLGFREVEEAELVAENDNAISEETSLEYVVTNSQSRKGINYGLETSIGSNGRLGYGAFINAPVSKTFSFGLNVTHNPLWNGLGKEYSTEVTESENQLIGPGTIKSTTTAINSETGKKVIGDVGFRTNASWGNFETYFDAKSFLVKEDKFSEGEKTIKFERNGELLEEASVITNTKENDSMKALWGFETGINYNLGNFALGGSLENLDGDIIPRFNFVWYIKK